MLNAAQVLGPTSATKAVQVATSLSQPEATVLAAVIGAAVALAAMFIKDVLSDRWRERRLAERSAQEIYRQYIAPVADTCEKIVWRASEIFTQNRHSFLKTATLPVEFNAYRRLSTLFRIGTLIGWIRAMNIELAAIPRVRKVYASPIAGDIAAFQRALADGPDVENQRLARMCEIWKLDLRVLDESARRQLASLFEVELHAAVGREQRFDEKILRSLDIDEQFKICERLVQFLCKHLNQKYVNSLIIRETINQSVRELSYREALIYRDWQDALGDAMLTKDQDSPRRYKTIGYEVFANLPASSNAPWVRVFATSIDDIDFDEVDSNDFRSLQLRRIAAAAASALINISASKHRDLVNDKTLDEARRLYERLKTLPDYEFR